MLAMLLVGSGCLLEEAKLTVTFTKTLERGGSEVMIVYVIRSPTEDVREVTVEERPRSLLTLGVNRRGLEQSSGEKRLFRPEFEVYFCLKARSVKGLMKGSAAGIERLCGVCESASLKIVFESRSQHVRLPLWTVREQFFSNAGDAKEAN
jgi:hypothetical protein